MIKDSNLIKEAYLGINPDENRGFEEDIEEEYDEEEQLDTLYSKGKTKTIIFKKFQSFDNDYLD
ncbi:hypothetical protein [Clostridium tarantellae]|uniref:Uncharacterized protein n=1 Tax=Clostridium tarantellae TaxID=39493 RepID=A0A6I1MKX8_9CLOT|nr:hypothetical protein [Clostridium tarantellae]MPQ44055.1 hypothetical protein [Clostridium tarantellae]